MQTSSSGQRSFAWLIGIGALIGVLGLLGSLQSFESHAFTQAWSIPGWLSVNGLFNAIQWRMDESRIAFALLLPLALITSLVLPCEQSGSRANSVLISLGMFAGLTLTLIADDMVSLLAGVSIATICYMSLSKASCLLSNISAASLFLMLCGLATLVACGAMVRAAPYGLPGESTLSISGIAKLVSYASEQHPAAGILWKQLQMLPYSFILLCCFLMAAIFPLHFWLPRAIKSCDSVTLLWVVMWSRMGIVLFSRLLQIESPDGAQEIMVWLWPILLCGCIYSAANFSRATSYREFLTWAILLSNQLLVFAYVLVLEPSLIDAVLISSTCGLVLLLLADPREQANTSEAHSATHRDTFSWVMIVVGICVVGAFPGISGMSLLWNSVGLLSNAPKTFGIGFQWHLLISTILFAVGVARFWNTCSSENVAPVLNANQKWIAGVWLLLTIGAPIFAMFA